MLLSLNSQKISLLERKTEKDLTTCRNVKRDGKWKEKNIFFKKRIHESVSFLRIGLVDFNSLNVS